MVKNITDVHWAFRCAKCKKKILVRTDFDYWEGAGDKKYCNACWHELLMEREERKPSLWDDEIKSMSQVSDFRNWEKQIFG